MQRWRNIGSVSDSVNVKQYSECLTDVDKNIRRQCVNSHLDLIILSLLNTKELSGYDLVVIIQKRFDILLSPGTIYPILKSLDSHKMVQTSCTTRKKLYKLTDQGSLYLSQLLGGYRDFLSYIEYMQREE